MASGGDPGHYPGVSRGNKGAANNAGRRGHPFTECCSQADTRPLCVFASGEILSRGTFSCKGSDKNRYGYLP